MKKLLITLLAVSSSVLAAPKDVLSERLAMTKGFSASFQQTVLSPEKEVILQGKGEVDIARPSLFRWTTTLPDESIIVSDGKSLWYYSPFIEQVSIYWQQQAMEQTLFVLLTHNRASDWDNYLVSQNKDIFTLTPTAIDSNQGQFEIDIDAQGTINGFTIIEQDGQQGQFVFNDYQNKVPTQDKFTFVIPDGVEIDDQRN